MAEKWGGISEKYTDLEADGGQSHWRDLVEANAGN
jgi:hypothetical protein